MKTGFGNLGLAAAAYNAGEGRVSRWLSSGGFLPLETENYVLDIMGEPADEFHRRDLRRHGAAARSEAEVPRRLPQAAGDHVDGRRHGDASYEAWGVQVAGNFRRAAADPAVAARAGASRRCLPDYEPVVSRVRTPIGRRGIYAVRIGVDNRATMPTSSASKLRGAGGSCIVMRNR